MKLLFITFDPLSLESSYLRRLFAELEYLEKVNKVNILSLSNTPDSKEVQQKYTNIRFFQFQAYLNGWEISNINEVKDYILQIVDVIKPDLVVLTVEYWDLLKELSIHLNKKVPFTAILHAMPFVVSPINPSDDFEEDVLNYVNSGIEEFKKKYILNHYKEASIVFNDIPIIANNKTVAFYLHNYFKNIYVLTQEPMTVYKRSVLNILYTDFEYDFIYMARMELGKGIEYLEDILIKISDQIQRPIKVVIIGRTDDIASKRSLDKLINNFADSEHVVIDYHGWANEIEKKEILQSSSVFIYPSHLDNFPTVVNEALSFGLPVITWDVPFSRINYSLTNAVIKVPLLNFHAFAENAIDALNNRNEISKEAYKFIEAFNLPKKAADLDIKIFAEVVSKNI